MNNFFNDTNHKRVAKMGDTLDLIKKSADTNGASKEDIWKMLEPVINDIEATLSGATPEAQPPQTEPDQADTSAPVLKDPNGKEPVRITIMNMARQAPLRDLTTAVAIFVDRIGEELQD